nr:hypothetical protein [Tanacetum cinerariifolium]
VELLEPGYELDDQEWVEMGSFLFVRLEMRGQGEGVRCHGSVLTELEGLGRDQGKDVELFKAMEMYQGACKLLRDELA